MGESIYAGLSLGWPDCFLFGELYVEAAATKVALLIRYYLGGEFCIELYDWFIGSTLSYLFF